MNAIVRDAAGLLYRVASNPTPIGGPGATILLPLEPAGPGAALVVKQAGARLAGPVKLAGMGIDVWLPQETVMTNGLVGVATVSAGDDPSGPWTEVPLTTGTWSAQMAPERQVLAPVSPGRTQGTAVQLTESSAIGGNGAGTPAARLMFLPVRHRVGQRGDAGDRKPRLPGRHRIGNRRHDHR